jgi:Protein of unknown function (DUF3738)
MKPAIVLLTTTLVGYGQSGVEPPKYEVASIKPNTDLDFRFAFRIESSGRLAATGITLKRLMMTAYNVQDFRIVGGPDWLVSRRWDVTTPGPGPGSPWELTIMARRRMPGQGGTTKCPQGVATVRAQAGRDAPPGPWLVG